MHDAEIIQEVRKKVGQHIELRVDANRNWTFQEAIQFGSLVRDCNLQYIEVYCASRLVLYSIIFLVHLWDYYGLLGIIFSLYL